jgi:hypothetical protein
MSIVWFGIVFSCILRSFVHVDPTWSSRQYYCYFQGFEKLDAALKEKNSSLAAEYKRARESGDYNIAAILAGEGVGNIKSVGKAYDIVDAISEEVKCVIQQLPRLLG